MKGGREKGRDINKGMKREEIGNRERPRPYPMTKVNKIKYTPKDKINTLAYILIQRNQVIWWPVFTEEFKAGEIAQWVQALATRANDLSLVLRTHIVERERGLLQVVPDLHLCSCDTPLNTQNK